MLQQTTFQFQGYRFLTQIEDYFILSAGPSNFIDKKNKLHIPVLAKLSLHDDTNHYSQYPHSHSYADM